MAEFSGDPLTASRFLNRNIGKIKQDWNVLHLFVATSCYHHTTIPQASWKPWNTFLPSDIAGLQNENGEWSSGKLTVPQVLNLSEPEIALYKSNMIALSLLAIYRYLPSIPQSPKKEEELILF